jgi:hypothetical protein
MTYACRLAWVFIGFAALRFGYIFVTMILTGQ